jgi:predicted Zn-dependent protease with MMP-like domain
MTDAERDLFDVLLEEALEELPDRVRLLRDMPLIVDDLPDDELLAALEKPESGRGEICGAFQKFPRRGRAMLTPFRPDTPSKVYLFREGIVRRSGGWEGADADGRIGAQIRATLREQIAHRFEEEKKDECKHWRAF